MAVQRLLIKEFLERSEGKVLLDVRSPAEYHHARIPGALSLPVFSNEERKIIGTAYKQQSREVAIKIGLDFFGPKMRKMVEEVETICQSRAANGKADPCSVFVYCWRGGMRSGALAWLLDLYGFKVFTLAGGYKSFRNLVLRSFEMPYRFKILGGFTGSGKTEILQQLKKAGEPVIDLEAIACHKGSAFGSYKMPRQPSQEMFENLLACELQQLARLDHPQGGNEGLLTNRRPIWLEDESQRIGDLNLPNTLWKTMRDAPVVFLEIPFENRLNHLVEEYRDCDLTKLIGSTQRISKRLGPLETKTAVEHLEKGELKEAFRVLLQYYDKRYLKGLHNRERLSSLLTHISCETVTAANVQQLTKYQPA